MYNEVYFREAGDFNNTKQRPETYQIAIASGKMTSPLRRRDVPSKAFTALLTPGWSKADPAMFGEGRTPSPYQNRRMTRGASVYVKSSLAMADSTTLSVASSPGFKKPGIPVLKRKPAAAGKATPTGKATTAGKATAAGKAKAVGKAQTAGKATTAGKAKAAGAKAAPRNARTADKPLSPLMTRARRRTSVYVASASSAISLRTIGDIIVSDTTTAFESTAPSSAAVSPKRSATKKGSERKITSPQTVKRKSPQKVNSAVESHQKSEGKRDSRIKRSPSKKASPKKSTEMIRMRKRSPSKRVSPKRSPEKPPTVAKSANSRSSMKSPERAVKISKSVSPTLPVVPATTTVSEAETTKKSSPKRQRSPATPAAAKKRRSRSPSRGGQQEVSQAKKRVRSVGPAAKGGSPTSPEEVAVRKTSKKRRSGDAGAGEDLSPPAVGKTPRQVKSLKKSGKGDTVQSAKKTPRVRKMDSEVFFSAEKSVRTGTKKIQRRVTEIKSSLADVSLNTAEAIMNLKTPPPTKSARTVARSEGRSTTQHKASRVLGKTPTATGNTPIKAARLLGKVAMATTPGSQRSRSVRSASRVLAVSDNKELPVTSTPVRSVKRRAPVAVLPPVSEIRLSKRLHGNVLDHGVVEMLTETEELDSVNDITSPDDSQGGVVAKSFWSWCTIL